MSFPRKPGTSRGLDPRVTGRHRGAPSEHPARSAEPPVQAGFGARGRELCLSDELRDNHSVTAGTTVDAPTILESCGRGFQADQFSFASRGSMLADDLLVRANLGSQSGSQTSHTNSPSGERCRPVDLATALQQPRRRRASNT